MAVLSLVSKRLRRIAAAFAPQLVAIKGVGPDVASTLLVTASSRTVRAMRTLIAVNLSLVGRRPARPNL